MCLAQEPQHSDAGEAGTRGPQSRVKHSTTEPQRSLRWVVCKENNTVSDERKTLS